MQKLYAHVVGLKLSCMIDSTLFLSTAFTSEIKQHIHGIINPATILLKSIDFFTQKVQGGDAWGCQCMQKLRITREDALWNL